MSWSALFSGDAVEVSDDKGEFTWQPASVIHPFISCHMYFVVFDTTIKAIVSSIRVRPRPESEHFISNFEFNQLVDVKIGGIWRPGIVCKVHVAEGKKFFGVNVGGREIEIENGSAEVRATVDWIDGKWSLATEKGRLITSHNVGNSNSTSEALHKIKTSHECKVTDAVNSMRDLTDEAPCGKSTVAPMPNIENKDLDKENKSCSNNLNFRSCKGARKKETIEENSRILNAKKPKHSECLESSSPKKLEFDVCMPISKEDPNFNIKSMADKLHLNSLFKTKESNVNNLSQESSNQSSKAEYSKEKILHGLFLQIARRHTSGERRRKNSKPRKLVIVETSLEGVSVGNQQPISSEQQNAAAIEDKQTSPSSITKSSLPFEKCSLVWESFKSMEIFTSMPQDPHFSPLVKHPIVYREGLAIGLMVTFSNLALSIPKLNLSDPPEKFDDIAKALHDLQQHGFNAQKLQYWLTGLIKLKEDDERLANKISKLKTVCLELTKEMESNAGSMSEMEQVLPSLNEATCRGLSEEREIVSELDELMMESPKFEDDILDAKLGFGAVLSSFL